MLDEPHAQSRNRPAFIAKVMRGCLLVLLGCCGTASAATLRERHPAPSTTIAQERKNGGPLPSLSIRRTMAKQQQTELLSASSPPVLNPLALGALMATIAYGKYGVLYPFLPLYFKVHLKLPAVVVGLFAMIWPLCIALASPLVTGLADRTGRHQQIFMGTQILSAALVTGLFVAGPRVLLLGTLLLTWALSDAAMTSFTDSALLGLLAGDQAAYGSLRCFGSLGYAIFVLASGQLQSKTSMGYLVPFLGSSLLSLVFALIISQSSPPTRLPREPRPCHPSRRPEHRSPEERSPKLRLRRPDRRALSRLSAASSAGQRPSPSWAASSAVASARASWTRSSFFTWRGSAGARV